MPKEIYLAGGCFWGVQKYFDCLPGVLDTTVGYANGFTKNPSYEEVYTGATGFAETVHVVYDDEVVDLDFILQQFYKIIDPTSLNRQGADVGSQYRTGIYYLDKKEEGIIAQSLAELGTCHDKPIVVENLPLASFYKAEERHQGYLYKNPGGYCHIPTSKFDDARDVML